MTHFLKRGDYLLAHKFPEGGGIWRVTSRTSAIGRIHVVRVPGADMMERVGLRCHGTRSPWFDEQLEGRAIRAMGVNSDEEAVARARFVNWKMTILAPLFRQHVPSVRSDATKLLAELLAKEGGYSDATEDAA